MKNQKQDLVIIGGGIMGLFTAYYASKYSTKIIILEKRTVGNKYSGSSGYSRSIRNDYLDSYYLCLASEAQKMWRELEEKSNRKFIINCGCFNIANKNITPILAQTYAQKSFEILKSLGFKTEYYKNSRGLNRRFPQFSADIGCLDIDAGFLYIPIILAALKKELKNKGVKIYENCEVIRVRKYSLDNCVTIKGGKQILTKNVALTVGVWSVELLNKIDGATWLKLPIIPIDQKLDYFAVPEEKKEFFCSNKMPVFAYLDVGIYGHPLYGKTPGLKVAYFDPLGAKLVKSVFDPPKQNKINNNKDFIRYCLPDMKEIKVVKEEFNYYDMTPDNNFIIDELPGLKNIFIAGGFCGTGFKFAPLVGRILAEMVFRKGTIFNVERFSAKRFGKISNLTFLKTLPLYKNLIFPRNWKYLKTGVESLLTIKRLP